MEMDYELALHHWMAVLALRNNHLDEVKHHVRHTIDLLSDDPSHGREMEELLRAVERAEVGSVGRALDQMVPRTSEPHDGQRQLYESLAQAALAKGDTARAKHYLDHVEESQGQVTANDK